MLNVKILCDDRFDPDLTYTIDDEKIANREFGNSECKCASCNEYSKCQGWKEIFNQCRR